MTKRIIEKDEKLVQNESGGLKKVSSILSAVNYRSDYK